MGRKGGEGREERLNGSMHPLGFSKVGAYVLRYLTYDSRTYTGIVRIHRILLHVSYEHFMGP